MTERPEEQVLVALSSLEMGFMLGALHEWRRNNKMPDVFTELSEKLLAHHPWKGGEAATAAAEVVRLREKVEALQRCIMPLIHAMNTCELAGEPIPDDQTMLTHNPFPSVTAGQVRGAFRL